MANVKTNAMRILDQKKIEYTMYEYDASDGKIDGESVADKIGKSHELLFKTLVARGNSKNIYVFIICILDELDLKKAAKAAGQKNIELVQVKELLELTGYIRGGCSPIGMKKPYKTFIDKRMETDRIIVSGGRIGIQLELDRERLVGETNAQVAELVKD